jgi:hypothetical protein
MIVREEALADKPVSSIDRTSPHDTKAVFQQARPGFYGLSMIARPDAEHSPAKRIAVSLKQSPAKEQPEKVQPQRRDRQQGDSRIVHTTDSPSARSPITKAAKQGKPSSLTLASLSGC